MEGEAETLGELPDEVGVGIGLGAAETVVEVDDGKPDTQPRRQFEQRV